MKQILICTDLDRTLLPNGREPESTRARESFYRLTSRPEVILVYVSGRNRELVEDAIQEYELPLPDWVIGDVGTTLYKVHAMEWQHLPEWEEVISSDWRGLMAKDLQPLFTDLTSLCLQEERKQNRYKLSYYLTLPTDVDALQREMSRRLKTHNISSCLVYSVDGASSTGLLDVLPSRSTKLHALEYLMQQQGFDYTNTVFAGDSGNDLLVLASAIPSIMVANAESIFIEQAKIQALQQGTISALYIAQGGFLGMNGNYSAGILEGIAYYHPDTLLWMDEGR